MEEIQAYFEAIRARDATKVVAMVAATPALAGAVSADGATGILLACYTGQPALAAALADLRAQLTIWEAAALGRVDELARLVDGETAAVDRVAADGFTPLGLAAFFGRLDAMRFLLTRGAAPNLAAQNGMRVRPLHSAAAQRDPEQALAAVELLLAAGASPNVAQHGGWTPLHQAAAHGDENLVTRLLAAGADGAAVSDDGRTAADMARENGFDAVVTLLEG